MRYDAAIIGASGDGLAAAIVLAEAGLRVVVLERGDSAGGRLVTREFHPGFHASPFLDAIAPVPADIFHALALARHGAVFAPASASLALWPDGRRSIIGHGQGADAAALLGDAPAKTGALLARAAAEAERVGPRLSFLRRQQPAPWPGEDWAEQSLAALARRRIAAPHLRAHLMASAFAARAGDPFLAGSASHLLAPADGGLVPGGLGRLAAILAARAAEAGAELRCGQEVSEIRRQRERVHALALADGSALEARAILSTLDLKQTFLSFFAWSALPRDLIARLGQFRMAAGGARLLLALEAPPDLPAFARHAPLHVAPDAEAMAAAHSAVRAGLVPQTPPMMLRLVSAADPGLAPPGRAVMTATLGAIPFRRFDGAWSHERREALRTQALAQIEAVLPGTMARLTAASLILPPDMEEALGVTEGDLCGGEIAADQMLGLRPWLDGGSPRTPIAGLYLAGPSTAAGAVASCASGVYAARAILADHRAGRLP